jgi:hypothetical protein
MNAQVLVHEQQQLAQHIQSLGPWFHNLRLGGIETAPEHSFSETILRSNSPAFAVFFRRT